jgi:class 3 adenylate cyclase
MKNPACGGGAFSRLGLAGRRAMKLENFFNQHNVIDLSFFNFRNAITAAYFANKDLEILKVNENFRSFFPILGNVTNAYFPDVLEQLGVPGAQIENFVSDINEKGRVLIPAIHISIDGTDHVYSLLSARTHDDAFTYLNGIQGQFVDRTAEWHLRKEREELLEQKIRDREAIEEKNRELEGLSTKLSKYLSPQVYSTIFTGEQSVEIASKRKKLTVFFSDIAGFTETTDNLESEELTNLLNHYLTEMSKIALEHGATIDKYVGDAILIFFGDPETRGVKDDAIACVTMAIAMQRQMRSLEQEWRDSGSERPFQIRIGINTGFCTVGNFGSQDRMDYTIIGNEVNLAARLESSVELGGILMTHETYSLVKDIVVAEEQAPLKVKGFAKPVRNYKVVGAYDELVEQGRILRKEKDGIRLEVNLDKQDKAAAIGTIEDFLSELKG